MQGAWLVRSLLAVAAAGFDKAVLYITRDDSCTGAACSVQFATSGLTTKKGEAKKKPSFYFVNAYRERLQTMGFDGEVDSGNAGVKLYRFRDAKSGKRAVVAWSPTSDGSVVKGYAVPLGGGMSAKIVKLADGQMQGVESAGAVAGGSVKIDVGEVPTIVMID